LRPDQSHEKAIGEHRAEAVDDDHKFNDDLLANDGDLDRVRARYPCLVPVLHDPELIAYFAQYNVRADAAKAKSRVSGKWAIVLGAVAIALAAVEIASWSLALKGLPLLIGGVAAVCGLCSVGIGALNVLFGARKRDWLHSRFMSERIRQFHFQGLIARLPQIITLLEAEGERAAQSQDNYRQESRRLLDIFRDRFEGRVDAKFTSAIGPYGDRDLWLHEPDETPALREHRDALAPLFAAYRELRIQHQLDYTNYKLGGDHALFSTMPVRQTEVLENLSKAGIAWLLLIHAAVLAVVLIEVTAAPFGHAESIISVVFCVAIIVIAVVALAARAFQQGLQPEREIERYQQYRSAVQGILEQFDESDLPSQKVMAMRRMERVAFDEMRTFLITNDRSSFAI